MMNDRGRNLGGNGGGVIEMRPGMGAQAAGNVQGGNIGNTQGDNASSDRMAAGVNMQNNGVAAGAGRQRANDVWAAPRVGGVGQETAAELTRMAGGEASAEVARTSAEMAREGIFSANSPEMDLTGNGEVTDSEQMMYADNLRDAGLKAPSLITFNDKGQEKLSDEAVEAVETAIKDVGDNMSELNTIVDDLSWTLVLNAYGRHRGDGLKS